MEDKSLAELRCHVIPRYAIYLSILTSNILHDFASHFHIHCSSLFHFNLYGVLVCLAGTRHRTRRSCVNSSSFIMKTLLDIASLFLKTMTLETVSNKYKLRSMHTEQE